jgi:RNA polymerase sigma-70 factor (ECF subfamily)
MSDDVIPESPPMTDELTFDGIYRDHRGKVLGAVRGVLGYDGETEDVVQLAFIEIHRALPSFRGQSKVSTWVYRIAVNVALQHIRRKQRRRWLILGAKGDETERVGVTQDAEARFASRQVLERVYAAVDRLSEKKRTAWVLYEMEGLAPAEISEVLGLPLNTVRSRVLAARRAIMASLGESGGES